MGWITSDQVTKVIMCIEQPAQMCILLFVVYTAFCLLGIKTSVMKKMYSLKLRSFFLHFSFYEQLKFHARLS